MCFLKLLACFFAKEGGSVEDPGCWDWTGAAYITCPGLASQNHVCLGTSGAISGMYLKDIIT